MARIRMVRQLASRDLGLLSPGDTVEVDQPVADRLVADGYAVPDGTIEAAATSPTADRSAIVARLRVLLRAAPTYLTIAAVIVASLADALAGYVDQPATAALVRILGIVGSALGAAILIVRRVTPVVEADRGLLPVTTGE